MKWHHWLGLIVSAALIVVAYVFGRKDESISESIQTEVDVIEARLVAKNELAELGAKDASRWVELRHQKEIGRLDDEEREVVERLRGDPVALSEYIIRTGKRIREKRKAGSV